MIPDRDAKNGYVAMAATSDRVIAVFSGRTLGECEIEASAGRDLHVFDWAGNLVAIYRLDTALRAVAVDTETGVVYGSRWATDPAVVHFKLPLPMGMSRSE
jgi:hypothetical protein